MRARWRDFVIDEAEAAAHVWRRWGVATQCYEAADLRALLGGLPGAAVETLKKVRYGWETEGFRGSGELPYDWIAVVHAAGSTGETPA